MVEGLMVAAGKSLRTGAEYKMILDLGGRSLIESSLNGMMPFCRRVIVVTGYQSEVLNSILWDYKNVETVFNPDYEEGMFSSIKTGLEHIGAGRFFFLPGDYPLISPLVYQKMLDIDAEIVIPTYNGESGHPVLFRSTVIGMILHSNRYTNLREFIAERTPTYIEIDCPGILLDIDTMEDYQYISAILAKQK